MNKFSTIIIILIFLLFLLIGFTILSKNSADETNGDVIAQTEDFENNLPDIVPLEKRDFLKDQSVSADEYNSGYFYLGYTFDSPSAGGYPPYVILYDANVGYFNVAIMQKPYSSSLKEAESYLSNLLGVSVQDLCNLSYTVSIPGLVDDKASGVDFRFSSCGDSTKLPN